MIMFLPDFYQQVEDFILNTIGSDMDPNPELNNEVRLFILQLTGLCPITS